MVKTQGFQVLKFTFTISKKIHENLNQHTSKYRRNQFTRQAYQQCSAAEIPWHVSTSQVPTQEGGILAG